MLYLKQLHPAIHYREIARIIEGQLALVLTAHRGPRHRARDAHSRT